MTDWNSIVLARNLNIPSDAVAGIATALDALAAASQCVHHGHRRSGTRTSAARRRRTRARFRSRPAAWHPLLVERRLFDEGCPYHLRIENLLRTHPRSRFR